MQETIESIDYFICHAYEDKQAFVRGLAEYLMKNGATVFYDEYSIKLGDSLTEKINQGLTFSRNAIIILSQFFFEKNWTRAELSSIFQRFLGSREFKLLVVYKDISHKEVKEKYPLLADILAVDASIGIQEVTKRIFEASDFKLGLKFLQVELGDETSSISSAGFCCSIRFQINLLTDKFVDKYILDFGQADDLTNRISAKVTKNSVLEITVNNDKYQSISLGCSVSEFTSEPKILTLNLSPQRNCFELYVDDRLENSLESIQPDFFQHLSLSGSGIIFNSLDLVHPCPATVSSFMRMQRQLNPDEVVGIVQNLKKFNQAIGR